MSVEMTMSSEHGLLIIDTNTGKTYRGDGTIINDSPVREVTRREIVPGTYGKVRVTEGRYVHCKSMKTAEELREAAHILNQIAEAIE